jgi:hypothetical protein
MEKVIKRTVLFAGLAMREALPSEKKTNSQRMISIFLCVYLLLLFLRVQLVKKTYLQNNQFGFLFLNFILYLMSSKAYQVVWVV